MSFRTVFSHRPFATMWVGRLLNNVGTLTQSVAIGWEVYATARLNHDPQQSMLYVGFVGLAQFLPMFALALLAGETADRYDRRIILFCCGLFQAICAAAFTYVSSRPEISLAAIFVVAGFFGIARAFAMPAGTSLLPALVPRDILPKAIAWNTLGVQGGMIFGPWLGGFLCAITPALANGVACGLNLLACITGIMLLRMWDSKIVLGAISLDLFAVLLGGVTALLPAYAKDILDTGPEGFGHLRSSFALGAGAMTLCLAANPIRRHAGFWILGSVILYGIATLVFALSRIEILSMIALAIAGAGDSVSVFVRQSLVQIVTPDAMRGRVSAVSGLFISPSNELGEFESGVAARLLGVVGSALFGGAGSIIVTGIWARLFPSLRKADRLTAPDR
jgi:MFS family permease